MRDIDPTASEFITSGYLSRSRAGGLLYDIGSIFSAAAPIVGGLLGSDSASDGIAAQTAASQAADATQRYQYDTTRADNAPFLNNGTAASNKLAQLLGVGGGGTSKTYDQIRSELVGQYTRQGSNNRANSAYGMAGTNQQDSADSLYGMGSGYWQPSAGSFEDGRPPPDQWISTGNGTGGGLDEAGLEAAIQAQLARQQQEQQLAQSDPSYGSLLRTATRSDLLADPTLAAADGYFAPLHDFGQADLDKDLTYQNGLQFGLDNGNNAINKQAAASGSQLSGATLKALTRFGNDYATTKTGDAYNRFTTAQNTKYGQLSDASNRYTANQTNTYNRLAGLAGAGQTASNTVTSAGANMANQVSNNATNLGNATAAAGIAGSNAIGSGLSGAYSNYSNNNLLSALRGGSATGYNTGSEPYPGYYASIGLK